MNELLSLKDQLTDTVTLAVQKGDKRAVFTQKGISNMLEVIALGDAFSGCLAADKVVGKAAALLMAYLKVKAVYAKLVSKPALEVFHRYHIPCTYEQTADYIINRKKDGMCPMEKSVLLIDDPKEAYEILKKAAGK